jgi:hypothetical protein
MDEKVTISEEGILLTPELHDAEILGVIMVAKDRALLPMRPVEGNLLCIVLNGVEYLRADDLREGNIVLDITVSTAASVEAEDIAFAHGLEKPSFASSVYLEKAISSFKSEEKILFRLNPSYGCTLACICSGIEVLDDGNSAAIAHWLQESMGH